MARQLPDKEIATIMLWLTFSGAPCPFVWSIISEMICDLANELLKCNDWNTKDLHASVQQDIPPRQLLTDDVPFATGRELIVDIPVDPRGCADVYINDTTGLTVDLLGTSNADRLKAAIPLAIKVAGPHDVNKPIPC